ncbi:hypothetical protein ACFLWL_01575 [Chloroflexota bacterium]
MGIINYIREYWSNLWNPDARTWQYIDRILFVILPFTSLILFITPVSTSKGWISAMLNLVWVIPLGIWLLFVLLVVPYRMVSKYHRRHKATIGQLLAVWVSGDKLKTEVYTRRNQMTVEDIKEGFKQWGESVSDVFLSNPNELGLAKLISLNVENKDAEDVAIPQDWDRNDLGTGYYIYLAVQTSKINRIIQDLSKVKG